LIHYKKKLRRLEKKDGLIFFWFVCSQFFACFFLIVRMMISLADFEGGSENYILSFSCLLLHDFSIFVGINQFGFDIS